MPPSLLLSILCCSSDGVAAFNAAVRPSVIAKTSSPSSSPNTLHREQVILSSMSNSNNEKEEVTRRDALAKFAATSATLLGVSTNSPPRAYAAEFSESPTSESSIVQRYGKKSPAPESPPAADASSSTSDDKPSTSSDDESKKPEDFDGNEAGAVGATDEGTQPTVKITAKVDRTKLDPNVSLPSLNEIDPKILGGAAILLATGIGVTNSVTGDADDGETPAMSMTGSAPPPEPYGLSGGRNYWDGVDMVSAKKAGLITTPKPTPPAPPAKTEPAEKPKPSKWKMSQPTPYGMQNPNGSNPFIKNVLDYCEGGKVTDDCSESVKEYLDDISNTARVASTAEVKAIVGYLDSLGDGTSSLGEKKKVGAAFTSYLDALSAGSAPPPSSGKAVKTYLDKLNGGSSSTKSKPKPTPAQADFFGSNISMADIVKGKSKPTDVAMKKSSIKFEMGMASPVITAHEGKKKTSTPAKATPVQQKPPVAASPPAPDQFVAYDNRLTSIEGRVTSLETKVDALPDQVFAKIEAWQSEHEGKLSNEVKKIVEALTPPPAVAQKLESPNVQALIPPQPSEPEPVAVVAPVAPPVPEPSGPVVQASPIGEIPNRGGMPQPGGGGGPRKGYGFGGGASWKTANNNSPAAEISTISAIDTPPAVKEPVVSEPVTPAVPANPIGEIPNRGGMPRDEFGHSAGPKKQFGFGAWKNNNMSP